MAGCWAGCCLPKRPGAARAAAAGKGGGEAGRPAAKAEPGGGAPVGEVEVVEVKREWCEMKDPEGDAGEEHFERVAAAAHEARERRLTAGQEALERAEGQGVPLGDADVEIVTQGHEWCQLTADSDEEDAKPDGEERRLSLASESFQFRERRLTAGAEVLNMAMRQGAPVGGDYDVEVVQQAGEWGELPEDSDDDDEAEEAALCRRATDAHLARERRLTAGAEAMSAALQRPEAPALATRDVAVVAQSKEWEGLEQDSDDEAAAVERRSLHASNAHKARERRLTAGAGALMLSPLQPGPPSREQEVAVVAQSKEWGEIEDSDGEDAAKDRLCRHAADAHQARERRLTVGAEALTLAPLECNHVGNELGVAVVSQSQEWGELERDSDEGEAEAARAQLDRHAAGAHLARERRLTASAEALALGSAHPGLAANGHDVEVVAQTKEWDELEGDSDGDEGSKDHFHRHATNAHAMRERRLTVGAEVLTLASHTPQPSDHDKEVRVTAQDAEWHELEDDSDQDVAGPEQLSRHATDAHAARERRLTAGAEAITLAMQQPATASEASNSIAVVAQSKEWGDLEEDSDEEVAASQHLSRRATDAHAAREKRLSVGAEALALGMQQVTALAKSSQDADVVAQSTEWGELGDDSDEEATKDQLSRHATEAHVAREKRLTAGAEAIAFAMQQPTIPSVASKGVAVVAQSKEWDELEEDSDDDAAAVEEKLSHHAANAHMARERRLTAGAESIAIAMQQPVAPAVSSKDVAVVAQATEWGELEEDSDEDAADKEELSRHATVAHTAREKRLTAGAAAIAFAMQQPAIVATAAKDVEVVVQSAEWGELEDDSDQEDAAPEQLSRHATGAHLAREKRLSVGAEAIGLAVPQPAVPATSSRDVAVVAQSKEWGELGEDSDEDAAPQEQRSRHASRAHTARERRLTAGAESIAIAMQQPVAPAVSSKDVAVVAQATEWGELEEDSDEDATGLERHATDAHVAREKRLTLGAESLALTSHLPGHVSNKDVEVIAQSKEWVEIDGDSEEENVAAEEMLCRHATDALKARERRLTAGAEALQLAPGSGIVA